MDYDTRLVKYNNLQLAVAVAMVSQTEEWSVLAAHASTPVYQMLYKVNTMD